MSKQVTWAKLKSVLFVPGGVGQIADTLPPGNKTLKNLKMTLEDSGCLYLEWDEGKFTRAYTVGSDNVISCAHPSIPISDKSTNNA